MASSFNDIVGQYLANPAIGGPSVLDRKKADVAEAARAKKYAIDPTIPQQPVPMENVAAVRQRGTGLSTITDPTERDLATMDNWSLFRKYGERTGQLFDQYNTGAARYEGDRQAIGTVAGSADRTRDVGISVTQGLINSALGIPAVLAGAVNNNAGVWAGTALGRLNDKLNAAKSSQAQVHQRLYGLNSSLDAADNAERYQQDEAKDGEFVATLKRIGRDTGDAASNIWHDPELLRDNIGQATGSLLTGGPISSGLKAVGRGVLKGAARAGIFGEGASLASQGIANASRGGAIIGRIGAAGEHAAMPLTIGAMEAGGAYQQTISDAVANLDQRTDLTPEQKTAMANKAGLTAAAIQFPIAAATGVITSKFESNPLAPVTARTAVGNMLKEALEEGTQSGSGQFAQNVGIRENVDQTRDLAQGVGEQIGQGAIGGLGSAGLVQAPHATLHAAVLAAKLGISGARAVGSTALTALDNRNTRILDQVASESPVSAPRMDAAANAAVQAAPEIHQAATAAVQATPKLNQEEKVQSQDYLDKLFQSAAFDDQEADNHIPVIGDAIRGSTDQFDAMRRVSGIASNEQADPHSRLAAGLYLLDKIRNNQSMIDQVPAAIEKMDDNDPALGQVRDFEDVMLNIQRHPEIRGAIQAALQFEKSITPDDVSDTKLATPEGQQAVQTAVQLSSLAPDKTNPDVNKQILLHAEQGKVDLTSEQKGYLQAANALHEAEQRHAQASEALGLTNSEAISKEIQSDEANPGVLHKSALAHMDGINAAIQAGNTQLAKSRMMHFVNFAQSMQNKVKALNANLEMGDGGDKNRTPYDAYNPRTGVFFEAKPGVYLDATRRGQVENAQQIAVDADAVGWLANELAQLHSDLGVKPIELTKLHAAVSQSPAREVIRDYRIAQRDGTLNEFMGLSQKTSPDRSPQTVLDETKTENKKTSAPTDQNNRQETETVDPIETRQPEAAQDPVRPNQDQRTSDVAEVDTKDQGRPQPSESQTSSPQDEQPRSDALSEAQKAIAQAAEKVVEKQPLAVKPNVVAEPVKPVASEESRPAPSSSIDVAFPNLLGSAKNLFRQAFRFPKGEPRSRIAAATDAVEIVRKALSSAENFRNATGDEKTAKRLKPDVVRAYATYLRAVGTVGKSMIQQLEAALSDTRKMGRDDVLELPENRALNIVTEEKDGKKTYDPILLQGAVLAGLQWAITADQRGRALDADDVSKILGVDEFDVTSDEINLFNNGHYFGDAVVNLSQMITRFWGVETNKDAPEGVALGVAEGVAKEVIRALADRGLVTVLPTFNVRGKTYQQISFAERNQNEKFKTLFDELAKAPSLIEKAVTTETDEVVFVDQEVPERPENQLRNRNVPLTAQQSEMRTNEQNIPYYVNTHASDFINALGEQGAVALFGHGDLENANLNAEHKLSLEGVNLGIASAVQTVGRILNEVTSAADAAGTGISETPIRYAHDFTSVSRLQILGRQNPQANKITREVIKSTKSTLDLSDRNGPDMGRFLLSVAQAWGVKVHKQSRDASAREARRRANNEYRPMIEAFQDWLKKGKASQALAMTDLIPLIRETQDPAKSGPATMAFVDAAIEYARMLNAEDRSKFETSMYVEADGVTDGPINAMVHMARGAFTTGWLQTVRKGGLFLTGSKTTINSFSGTDEGKTDLYQQTTNYLVEELSNFGKRFARQPEVIKQLQSLKSLMVELGMDMRLSDDGDLIIDRGAVKNPLTVRIYGSGDKGIASKIAQLVTKAIYERESEILQDPNNADLQRYRSYLNPLIDNKLVIGDFGAINIDDNGSTNLNNNDAKFKLSGENKSNLHSNILGLYVRPMAKAISRSIGETELAVNLVRDSTDMMSRVFKDAFQRDVKAKLTAVGRRSDQFLTRAELQEIYDKNKHLAPYIQTGTQSIMVGGSERTNITAGAKNSRVEFSRALDGTLSTSGYYDSPAPAGVSGIPYTVIATGDGQMMQNFSTEVGAGSKHMLVFDGANFSLDQLEDNSQLINKAVHDGWLKNPFGDVTKAFDAWIKSVEAESDLENQKGIIAAARKIQAGMTEVSREIQARKNVLSKVKASVDHMASAESPYVYDQGEDLGELNDNATVDRLNQMYREEFARLSDEKPAPKVEETQDNVIPVSIVQGNDIIRLVDRLSGKFGLVMARSLALKGFSVLSGSIADLRTQLRSDTGLQIPEENQDVKGFYVPGSKKLYLVDGAGQETLIHEMTHASTVDQLADYYENKGANLNSDQIAAIDNIDKLMDQWLDMTTDTQPDMPLEVRQSIDNARRAIFDQMRTGRTGAVSEFIAWNLSNQNLINFGKSNGVKGLSTLIANVTKAIVDLIKNTFGINEPGKDFYSNLRFNTAVVMSGNSTPASSLNDTLYLHSEAFGDDQRIARLQQVLFDKIAAYAHEPQGDPAKQLRRVQEVRQAQISADIVSTSFASAFPMTQQQLGAFQMLVQAFGTAAEFDPNAMQRINELYEHVTKELTVEDFMLKNGMDEQADRFQAHEKYNRVLGKNVVEFDEHGRSTLMPAFMALANIDDQFRAILNQMDLPKGDRLPNTTMDNRVTNIASDMMDTLSIAVSGERLKAPSIGAALTNLTDRLVDIADGQVSIVEQLAGPPQNLLRTANEKLAAFLSDLAAKAEEKLSDKAKTTTSKGVRLMAQTGVLISGIFNEDLAENNAIAISSFNNKYINSQTMHEFFNELIGRTSENAGVYDMIKMVRSAVQAIRQQFREHLPEFLAGKFTRELTDNEWSAIHRGMAKADIASFNSGYSQAQIFEFLTDPVKVTNETKTIEQRIRSGHNGALILSKARDLGDYIVNGKAPVGLIRNAQAIERLHGSNVAMASEVNTSLVSDIDHLVSLYAVEGLNQEDKDALSALVQAESDGMSFMLSYMDGQRTSELAGIQPNSLAMMNHYKGYVPSIQTGKSVGKTLRVAPDSEYLALRQRGFVRVADYESKTSNRIYGKRGYYYAPVSDRSVFNQGITQTVHTTTSGVDPRTGFTTGTAVAGRITEPGFVDKLNQLHNSGANFQGEKLLPVYGVDGKVVAYEESIDPDQEIRLGKSTHAAEMMGVWRGRQEEEKLAAQFNRVLVERLHDLWDKEELSRKDEYVNLFAKDIRGKNALDPVIRDAVKLIPFDMREQIEGLYGKNQFWVRRDLINDTIGYRKASVGDFWSGTTRWSEETQKQVRSLITDIFGIDAYKYLVTGEKLLQNLVTDAKVLIVVKSVFVPMANLLANVGQLTMRGVPVDQTLKNLVRKTAEVNGYIKDRIEVMKIEGDLRAARNDVIETRKLNTRKQSIEDGWKRLSISPLIDAGEFSSISDVGIGKEEIDLAEGKLTQYIEKLTDKLPSQAKTAGKYFFVTKDTALFKGLQRTVEYGDFLAKAILYDHLTKTKKVSHEDALAAITEEFVNYDRLAGRVRDVGENFGLTWFWNFKIRSTKVALSIIRNNPLYALMAGLMPNLPMVGAVGNPVSDNILSVGFDGRLGHTIGPMQGFRSHAMIPWINLVT